jgi:hypothetical protein
MELVIKEFKQVKAIDFNYEEIKKELEKKLSKYQGLVYNEESIKEAKTDRADLNKLKKAINDKKIEVKKDFMQPYTDFEDKVKELMELIDKPILEIDTQIKNFEETQREEKRKAIEVIFDEKVNELKDIVKLEVIFDEKWLNATTTIKSVETDIDTKLNKIRNDLKVISELGSEFETELTSQYLKHFDLGQVITENNRLKEQKENLNKLKEKQEVIREEKAKEVATTKVEITEEDILKTYTLEITGTVPQFEKLKEFMDLNKMTYKKVK